MREVTPLSTELVHIPPVLLTGRAFQTAQENGITAITPDAAEMQAVIDLTGGPLAPDITLLRRYSSTSSNWDQAYQFAPPDFPYIPAGPLAISGRDFDTGPCSISAGIIRNFAQRTGKTVLDLSVCDWDSLGSTLADALEELKAIQSRGPVEAGLRAADAFGYLGGKVIKASHGLSPRQRRVSQASGRHPYRVSWRQPE